MKTKMLFTLVMFWMAMANLAPAKQDKNAAVKKAIIDGYIQGVFLKGDPELIRHWWHRDSEVFMYRKGEIQKVRVSTYLESLEKRKSPLYPGIKISYEIKDIKVAGNAALVTVNIFFNGKQKYTDFMNLYQFPEGWKIVTKTYFSHF